LDIDYIATSTRSNILAITDACTMRTAATRVLLRHARIHQKG